MKRNITVAVLIIVCYLLQSTVFQSLSIASISPNLLVIVTSTYGFMRGKKEGMIIGFVCGFLVDLFSGNLIGLNALIYTYIGFINGFFKHAFYDDDVKLPMFLITASDFVYGIMMYGILFLLRGRLNFPFYLKRIILPEVVYTVVVTIVLYRIILGINHRLEASEKRSANRFV